MPITNEYGPSIYGPVLDDYLDPGAIAYIVNDDDEGALLYLVEHIEELAEEGELEVDTLPSTSRLAGIIEWWCREEYPNINY